MLNSPAVTSLRVNHVPHSEPAGFQVVRLSDGKMASVAEVPSPVTFPVEGRKEALLTELQWYLEKFLDRPFSPDTEHAERVIAALKGWGEQAFLKLFGGRDAARLFDASTAAAYSNLHLLVASDDPRILAWPWEALRDPELGWLGQTCQVERRLNKIYDPPPIPDSLPKDRINILLVVARPFERDVRFRTIARPLVELIEKGRVPASVEVLRPPTFDHLCDHLREHPGYYHILHFDGHGAYGDRPDAAGGYKMQAPEGKLVFEDASGKPDLIPAEKLSALLREHALPGVVLNACQSAMIDAGAQDPFASVATALLASGMRDVVAMAYSLYVSGAQQFLPAFYRGLFEGGSMAKAVRLGRQQMWKHDGRVCARGKYPLQDWLLPVLYRQEPMDFSFASGGGKTKKKKESKIPAELRLDSEPYGFIGRDSAILALERALRRPTPAVLIQGLGGVGKTTLAKGLLEWLDATGGLGFSPLWFSFQEIRSAEYVFNRLGEALLGAQFGSLPLEKKLATLAETLRENRLLIVWDNFESAAGIAGTAVSANMPQEDRSLLAVFLDRLRGGETKVIITSRSREDWLGPQRRYLLELGGMDREERWEYCEVVLRDLGLTIDREDRGLAALMDQLGGHPLAMRAILPRLEKMTAAQVLSALLTNMEGLGGEEDEALKRVYATLGFVRQSLPAELQELLVPLGLHENYVDADYLEDMAGRADPACTRTQVDSLLQALVVAGLLRDIGQSTYEMHPLLTSYLRTCVVVVVDEPTRDKWARAFVHMMGTLADALAPRELHEQRVPFLLHGQNFYYALEQAVRLGAVAPISSITQSLGQFGLNGRNFTDAARLYRRLAEVRAAAGDLKGVANAYHQLGTVAHEQRDFDTAETWYRKSLKINKRTENEVGIARNYHQLGVLAQFQGKLLPARGWYRKSLAMLEKLGNEEGVATISHQLGLVAQTRGDFAEAERLFLESLRISKKIGRESRAATTVFQLGRLADDRKDYAAAADYSLKAASIFERLSDEPKMAQTYNLLGTVCENARDWEAAERWYRMALAIQEKIKDDLEAGRTYGNLGNLEGRRGNHLEGGRWHIKSIQAFRSTNDPAGEKRVSGNFLITARKASAEEQRQLRAMWEEAGLGAWPEDDAGQP
jgi:tetratricopeptide (TPR) repeat protein